MIFDECTSGFRETFGGLHKKYGVNPDIAMFGKALGNGYAITAVLGRKDIMDAAQATFISSTFWTERIGPTAALKTLEIMEEQKSWNIISNLGDIVREQWTHLSSKYGLEIEISGLKALSSFKINSANWLKYKTYITQEMLKKGFLASNTIYLCTSHDENIIDKYISTLEPIFAEISHCENSNENIDKLLENPVCHSGFSRLN